MYISMEDVLLITLSFIISTFLICLILKKASVNGQILNFSFGENEHLRYIQSKIFIFGIPAFTGIVVASIGNAFGYKPNTVLSVATPTSIALLFTVSSIFFTPELLIEPLRKKLVKTRLLYLGLAIIYGIISGASSLFVDIISDLSTKNLYTFNIFSTMITAFVLWVIGFVIYLVSIKGYKGIKSSYDKEYYSLEKKKDNEHEMNYIIRNEIAKLFSDTLNSAYGQLQNELTNSERSTKDERLLLLNRELSKRVTDLEHMIELAYSTADARIFKKSFSPVGYLPSRQMDPRPDFYNFDIISHGGYFG